MQTFPLRAGAGLATLVLIASMGALPASTPMHVTVALRPRDPVALAKFAVAVSTPGDPAYRQYLRPGDFAGRFGALPSTIDASPTGGTRLPTPRSPRLLLRSARRSRASSASTRYAN